MPFVHLDLGFTKGLGEVVLRGTLAWVSPFHRQAQTEPRPSGALSLPTPSQEILGTQTLGTYSKVTGPFLLTSHKLKKATHKRAERK